MGNFNPYFSIVVPTYNRAPLIGRTMVSILSQEWGDFEILIVDDGSQDNTEEVIREFSDQRIHYFKKENAERGAARNYGRARAKGKYINFFDSDDLMYSSHLSTAKNRIDRWQNPEFFHLGYDFQTPEGRVTKKVNFDDSIRKKALFDNLLSCNGVFVRQDIAEKFPFEENRNLASAEDWELWIRLMSRFTLYYDNEITTSVVSHDQRSIRTITTEKIITRDMLLVNYLKDDAEVRKMYGKKFNSFIADRYTYFMLCLSEDKKRKEVAPWALRALGADLTVLFSRRFLASIKNCVTQ